MTLLSGSRLGPYEILTPLGKGGMGEVWRARDTRLDREVALKLLTAAFSQDAERLARFDREARLLASLSHPNIATIYGFENVEEQRILSMELVLGDDLSRRLATGPIPVPEALAIARQVLAALAEAHAHGVVHRDLKPANVVVADAGRVKVLDFGLAKVVTPAPIGDSDTEAPTLARESTRPGTVLGTPAYMSPEQARGRSLDRSSDLWSFGCLLYEMLTARRAFPGDTFSDTLVAILEREPDWSRLPPETPARVRELLRRCLVKDSEHRLRDAGAARLDLEEPTEHGHRARASRWVWPALVTLLALALLWQQRARDEPERRLAPARLSQVTVSEGIEGAPAWSPDGTRLAFTREDDGLRRLVVREVAAGTEREVTRGETDALQPAWSADGHRLLFVQAREVGRKLEPGDVFGAYEEADVWSLDIETGREERLIENAFNPAVSPDGDRIAVDASWAGPRRLWVLDARGRNPEQVSADDSEAAAHLRPRWSPDSARLVFQNLERTQFDVRVVDLASKAMTWLTQDQTQDVSPVWSPSGHHVYFSSPRGGGLNIWRVAVSADGRPTGRLEQITTGAGQDVEPAFSRDGERLAFAILHSNADLWRLPLDPTTGQVAGEAEALTSTTREDSRGSWSRDGSSIAFNSDRSGEMNVWLRSLDDGTDRQLTKGPGGDFQPDWWPDGRSIAFFSSRAGSADIWRVDVESGALTALTTSRATEANPSVSPDGARVAYVSDDGGRLEVWLMNADGSEPRRLTSTGVAGHFLRWHADGRGVIYRAGGSGARLMSVPVGGGEATLLGEVAGGSHLSLSPDTTRVMDVLGHQTLWVTPIGSEPERVFAFEDPRDRIDYPAWSPDGRFVLFDRFRPRGGDVWVLDGAQ